MKKMFRATAGLLATTFASLPAAVNAAETLTEAVQQGTTSLQIRPRFEYVDQDGRNKEANALTTRTQLGLTSGDFHHFKATLEFESVNAIGDDNYNNTRNGKTGYPVVADPADSEINQINISYSGFSHTTVTFGRQLIAYDNQRFIGTVGWRQNEVSMDAFSIDSQPLENLALHYAYVDNVNRLFGNSHPGDCNTGAACAEFDMSSHLLNASYTGLAFMKVTGYGYFLEFDDLEARSSQTLGIQLSGAPKVSDIPLIYHVEYATQSDYADGSDIIDATYTSLALGTEVGATMVKLGQETLGGDGRYGFGTPLATVHAFNGWADMFLTTPVTGLVDTYLQLASGPCGK
ncbi:MAG: hypothetical protein CMI02_17975 [Oceanospirillaceae bacterium]|nr:hypothetical protein [Oceanospirillaceae bacterium]MBT13914.1 hypothetical protein [Oceanospirillaceae bacterium]|tara:strand:- start:26 stop:1066 length:1041 start_codon:yes stop_codon:yes gene_type:complete